jgi:hypothetical protein
MSLTNAKSHIKIALESIQAFANDGKLDLAELQKMLDIASADGVLDADEKATLRTIVAQAEKSEVTPDVASVLAVLKTKL